LWSLLEDAKVKDVKKLQVLGDFKLVIDWAHQKNKFQNIWLTLIMRDIKLAYQSFEWIYFSHILRDHNAKDNELSKEALSLLVGAFVYYKFIDGEEIEATEFQL
jgi:hypothetical protein